MRTFSAMGDCAGYIWKYFGTCKILCLNQVGPLRDEVQILEIKASESTEKSLQINDAITKLEASIFIYKEEYAVLINDTQLLKNEMKSVKIKVERSELLLNNLSSERYRWDESKITFMQELETLVGDALIASAFISYAGFYDQFYRQYLQKTWCDRLEQSGIRFQKNLSIPEYLATTEKRNGWSSHYLPTDVLCSENAVIIERSLRYPLIIDPSLQSLKFLQAEYKKLNIVTTSFLDSSFLKILESALRFGNPLLVTDAEFYDPIINPLLNHEVRKIGGRTICQIGSKDIDISPSFNLFLFTKNPSVNFSATLSSRVSFVNFSVTHESLQMQCLDRVLSSERPDIESKRKDLIKMQGEYQMRLLFLEKSLLAALNESHGNILEDDRVLNTLETLKKEALDVAEKIEQTDQILEDVQIVTDQFSPIAEKCSSIFFIIQRLSSIQNFYQFSLEYFFTIIDRVLKNSGSRTPNTLEGRLFAFFYNRISQSLRKNDVPMFALLLAELKDGTTNVSPSEREYLLVDTETCIDRFISDPTIVDIFGDQLTQKMMILSQIPAFKKLPGDIISDPERWRNISTSPQPEKLICAYFLEFSSGIIA